MSSNTCILDDTRNKQIYNKIHYILWLARLWLLVIQNEKLTNTHTILYTVTIAVYVNMNHIDMLIIKMYNLHIQNTVVNLLVSSKLLRKCLRYCGI